MSIKNKKITQPANQNGKPFNCSRRYFLTGSTLTRESAIFFVLDNDKIARKPNEEANSQSSQLDEEDLQKLEEEFMPQNTTEETNFVGNEKVQ